VKEPGQAKVWLQRILPHVTDAKRRERHERGNTAVNIALTWPGLQQFGILAEAMLTFPREYWQGMGHGERRRVLGDTGECDPQYWEFGGGTENADQRPTTDNPQPISDTEIHLLLMLYGHTAQSLDEITERCWSTVAADSGLTLVYRQDSHKESDKEPFGFKDGISQPAIADPHLKPDPGQDVLNAGEFLIGYQNAYGQPPPMPSIAAAQDPANLLTADPDAAGRKAFGLNGSYLVVRKLEQDVTGFWDYMDRKSRKPDGTSDPDAKTLLAAKFVGRWPSGAPLPLAPERDDPALGQDDQRNNVFTFLANDAEGFRCPIGAHMRRANPRDTMPPNPQKSLQVASHHRIIRRGRPYKETQNGVEKQGLIFMALNADLQRQFEFIQQSWINSPKFNGLFDNPDPLIGNFDPKNNAFESDLDGDPTAAPPQGNIMVLQANPVRRRICDVPNFVQMKGGAYFFLPGMKALHYLAQM
jgi:Dyp-type peroxidase family